MTALSVKTKPIRLASPILSDAHTVDTICVTALALQESGVTLCGLSDTVTNSIVPVNISHSLAR